MALSQLLALVLLKSCLTSGAHSDLTITCGKDTYKVHKVVVCGRAGFFERAVRFGGQESHTNTIDLPEDEPEMITLLLDYLYEGEYSPALPPDGVSGSPTRPSAWTDTTPTTSCEVYFSCQFPYVCPHHTCGASCGRNCKGFVCKECDTLPELNGTAAQLLTHAKMYELGDKYDVTGLKELASEKFSRACKHFWNTPDFAVAAHHAFSTTVDEDKGLRDPVSATICEHIELLSDPGVNALMTQLNGLAFAVLQGKVKEHGWGKKK